ncbi:SGNH/GDSL hydrolase family protein [Agromyces sp. GXQ0307]|uniref:SGNH/GDSL hydrolase family protein n=1 Tax=Agromyces sp. GXQ0307 TaxID=3377835 RepID=UPI00383A4F51
MSKTGAGTITPSHVDRRRVALLIAALLAAPALVLGAAVTGPADTASAAVATGKPDKPGKPGGGGGGGTGELAYSALGDSFASGTGSQSYIDSTDCDRSSLSYPKLLDADATANVQLVAFPACSGASTADVINSQVRAIARGTTRVTLTVGGNDLGFSNVMTWCFVITWAPGTCDSYLDSAESLISNGTLGARITSTVNAIAAKAPKAKIVVTGYPLLFDPASGYANAARVNADTVALNAAIKGAAESAGAVFVDVAGVFTGRGIGSAEPWINGFSNTSIAAHPNQAGNAAYAEAVRAALR